MSVFFVKSGDTRPILEVSLKNPDGSAHDLTGSTSWKLHIHLSPTSTFTRDLVVTGAPTLGTLRYTWTALDWVDPAIPAVPVLPVPASAYHILALPMEYEITGGSSRLTFPNDGYDTLEIRGDVA